MAHLLRSPLLMELRNIKSHITTTLGSLLPGGNSDLPLRQDGLQGSDEVGSQQVGPLQVDPHQVTGVEEDTGQTLRHDLVVAHLESLLDRHVEPGEVGGQDLLSSLLGTEDPTERPERLSPARLELVLSEGGREVQTVQRSQGAALAVDTAWPGRPRGPAIFIRSPQPCRGGVRSSTTSSLARGEMLGELGSNESCLEEPGTKQVEDGGTPGPGS